MVNEFNKVMENEDAEDGIIKSTDTPTKQPQPLRKGIR